MAAVFEITVSSNASEVAEGIRLFAEDQLPFATSRAVNRIAEEIRQAEARLIERRFRIVARWMVRAFRLERSHKRQWPDVHAVVGHPFWATKLHELGDPKTGGRAHPGEVFIPTKIVAQMRSRSTGQIPARLRPRALLQEGGAGFRSRTKKFGEVVMLHRADGLGAGRRLRIAYLVRSEADLKARFGFGDEAKKLVSARYGDVFGEEMTRAVLSGRAPAGTTAH